MGTPKFMFKSASLRGQYHFLYFLKWTANMLNLRMDECYSFGIRTTKSKHFSIDYMKSNVMQ